MRTIQRPSASVAVSRLRRDMVVVGMQMEQRKVDARGDISAGMRMQALAVMGVVTVVVW